MCAGCWPFLNLLSHPQMSPSGVWCSQSCPVAVSCLVGQRKVVAELAVAEVWAEAAVLVELLLKKVLEQLKMKLKMKQKLCH